jgi:hypothetical protein
LDGSDRDGRLAENSCGKEDGDYRKAFHVS